ncbi:MAG: hypothetical protein Q9175_000733 [Cornicularia normoerica]
MRLASGHRGLGLQGMRFSADIPECWGVHSVHRSGQIDSAASRLRREEERDPASPHAQNLRQILARDDTFEKGGVRILRPLLGFSKERLIQTCRALELPWEEDKTNIDTWRTPRNNIRGLLRSSKLPQALQKLSILRLAKQASENMYKTQTIVLRILSCSEILLLDARCGGLIVRLPCTISTPRQILRGGEASTKYMRKLRLTATLLLQKLVQIVTPQEEVSLQSLKQAAVSIFPELNDGNTAVDRRLQPTNLTAGGAQFERLHSPLLAPQSELDPAISGTWQDLDPTFVWKLTRQPFSKAPPSLTVQPSANTECTIANNPPPWSSWQLWDGRYWIRLLNHSCRPLIVRSFQVPDLEYLRSTLTHQRYKEFRKILHLAAPGKVRWTLLAVAELGDDALDVGRVLALPTLGQAGIFDFGDRIRTDKVEWQIRYKSVVLGHSITAEIMNHGKTPVDTLSKPDNTASTPNPIPAYLIVLGLSKEEAFYKAPDGTIIKRYHLRILYVLIQYRVAVKLFRVEETR